MTDESNTQKKSISKLAIYSLVLAVAGISAFAVTEELVVQGLGGVFSIIAVVCAHKSRRQIKTSSGALSGNGIAITGMVLGYLILVPLVAGFLLAIFVPIFSK